MLAKAVRSVVLQALAGRTELAGAVAAEEVEAREVGSV